MATLILYKTLWGSTKQYAEWIKQEVEESNIENIESYRFDNIEDYDKIIIGSRVYKSNIEALPYIQKHWEVLSKKQIYFFMVGLIPMDKPDSIKSLNSIPENIRMQISGLIKLPGRIDYSKLSFLDKQLVKLMGIGEIDGVDISHIAPIVDWAAR